MESLKDRLYLAMVRAGLRAVDVSQKTGISKSSLSRYLSGGYEPNGDRLHRLAVALDVSEAYLLGYDVAPDREPEDVAEKKAETLEEEMSRRMLEQIAGYYERLTFSGKVALFEDVKKREAGHVYPET